MPGTLKEYNKKRHFTKTAEPPGKIPKKRSRHLTFVVQHHIASRDHYDFRLEWDGVLKSWAVPKGPSYSSRDKRLAMQVEDHPLDYGGFEGTIPKGEYGGGTVMLWDQGQWHPQGDAAEGLAGGSLKFTLDGKRLKGAWALVRMKPKEGEKSLPWLLIKEKDEYENAYDIREFDASVTTGRTMEEIADGEEPRTRTAAAAKKKAAAPAPKKPSGRAKRKTGNAEELLLAEVVITNPDKVLYGKSGITKGEVAAYYHKVSNRMLPYLKGRILSAVRCPGGIGGGCFYKKHPASSGRGVITVMVPGSKGGEDEYFYIADVQGLMSEVQMNTLEFHTWGSRADAPEKPDIMVFDLDPDEELDLERIRQGVRDIKDLLDELSLKSYLKTSGGKGYHVVLPFAPGASWDTFSDFARNTARTMEAMHPGRYTSNVRKNQRKNRIFIDWIRNGRGATSIAPYSVRAREGAPVSMPISWKELDTVTPAGVTMEEALARLRRKDPWQDFFSGSQRLK